MRRREFIAGLGGAAAWPVAVRAQQPAIPVIGLLSGIDLDDRQRNTVRQGLNDAGYAEGLEPSHAVMSTRATGISVLAHRENSENQPGRVRHTEAVGLSIWVPHGYVGCPAPGEGDDGIDIRQNRCFPLYWDSAS
jgi:hypothetical protein